jgi:transposase
MEVVYPRCAGVDVHAKTVVACVRIASGATVTYEHRTVWTNTRGLLELADWLTAQDVTHVAMEATGVYWKPVWHVLEEHVTLVLANAMHLRNIPGRKSDKNDATWSLLSWAGLCPRLDESAGKRRSTRTRQGAPWLKTTLVQIAWPASRKKQRYFQAQFLRLKTRRGPKKAIVAVAASMLTDVYYMLRDGTEFHDLGDQYFAHHDKARLTNRLLKRLRDLGVEVEVKAA